VKHNSASNHHASQQPFAPPTRHSRDSPERRRAQRHLTVLRVALIRTPGFEGLGIVRNISQGGMMLETFHELVAGQTIELSLIDEQTVGGQVVWVNGTTAGVKFRRPTPIGQILAKPENLPDGRRPRLPRLRTDRAATVETINGSVSARIEDVSSRGAKLVIESGSLPAGTEIVVRLPDAGAVKAATRWAKGTTVGIEFFHPLSIKDLLRWLPS
jgi:hypothetical protein